MMIHFTRRLQQTHKGMNLQRLQKQPMARPYRETEYDKKHKTTTPKLVLIWSRESIIDYRSKLKSIQTRQHSASTISLSVPLTEE